MPTWWNGEGEWEGREEEWCEREIEFRVVGEQSPSVG